VIAGSKRSLTSLLRVSLSRCPEYPQDTLSLAPACLLGRFKRLNVSRKAATLRNYRQDHFQ